MSGKGRAMMQSAVLAGASLAMIAAAPPPEPGSRQTREFVQASAQSDQFEILEAQSATTESKDPQVRRFAEQMIRDHGTTSAAMRAAVSRSGLKPPQPGISSDQASLLAALQSARGANFDKLYWTQQALAHRAALVTVQRYISDGDDPNVKAAAQAAQPIISAHLQMAEQMHAAAGD